MSPSFEQTSPARAALARFDGNHSVEGRLAQYMRGRIRGFWLRQTLTAFGSITLAVLEGPWLGMALAVIALIGEGCEIVLLRRALAGLALGRGTAIPARIGIAAAGLQALSISACVAIAWTAVPLSEARFFAMAFLISAMTNAGLVRSLFAEAADVRLTIYFILGIVLLAMNHGGLDYSLTRQYGYEAASFLLLCYTALLFIRLLERMQFKRWRSEFSLLKQQVDQEDAALSLASTVEENRRLALVAQYATDSILISGADERILWVNEAFTKTTGYSAEEAIGKTPGELLNAPETDPAVVKKIIAARAAKQPLRTEIRNRTKSGRVIWVETSINPVFDEQGQHRAWVAVERDISQAKEREQELAAARIAAEEAGQSKSRFVANMSHEIRTPMNGVIGVAELLSETELTPQQANYVDTIIDSGRALLAVINDILDLAKLQSGKAVLENRPFSPAECIENAMKVLRPAADKKGIALLLEGGGDARQVLGDEGKIRQIVLNLVGNALKFTKEGSVTVTLRLAPAGGSGLEIDVHDTGIGIAKDRLSLIFESFSQAETVIGRQFGGTGLGLTICAMLADQMGGGISVQSELGRGSTFCFRAPLPLVTTPSLDLEAFAERRSEPRLRPGLRVLVAEDNRTNMMIVRKMLDHRVKSVAEAGNGAEAVTLYRAAPPDLVLMDMSMPVMDGLRATSEIRAYEHEAGLPRCPIIALTANAFGEDREACIAAGMDSFLTKPLSRLDLLAEIAAHLPERPIARKVIGL